MLGPPEASPIQIGLRNVDTGTKMSKGWLVLFAFALIGYAPTNAQEQGAAMSSDLVAPAKAFVDLLVKKDFSRAESYFDATMKTALPLQKLDETWQALVAQAGSFKRQVGTRIEERSGFNVVIVTCEFEKSAVDMQMFFDPAKRIVGLFFAPAQSAAEYTPPRYVKSNAFREKEATVGTGKWALPGTLTLPLGQGLFPAVVLVHGSGPLDRDETIGPNKPFRDLAWGLASQGIAVLRYEKRTKQHAAKLGSIRRQFTVKEETIDDVLAAVALLRQSEGIDTKRIFVLGHSLGGMLVPRIGTSDPHIAGFIILAGATKPPEEAILEQNTYLFSLDRTMSEAEQAQLEELKKQVARVKNLQPSDVNSSLLLFGAPPSYWLDLRGYEPAEAAKLLKQRMMILQGERDFQVTMDQFQKWQAALSSQQNVTFKSYPKLNHLFIEGNGKSKLAEYNVPGHVAEIVIHDIADWIKK